ncbi:hypothetical protein WICPIJ_007111 [Wickerhamomyces pijperi]|uniref:Inositol-pentakisphosphate 2-kinase n=1 Tax=Wickerhamomyces pijperi TaxID=599730 RepID=A0A9P8Q2D7_WICPI|nr:hypothetical protein WICPIJ_007111 [Wickerhamomyces pijperi]
MLKLSNAEDWKFYGKGNANIVYKYQGSDLTFHNKLLRLRQSNQIYNTRQIYIHYNNIPNQLSQHAIQLELVQVSFLKEGCLETDQFGLLMPDLTQGHELVKKERYYSVFQSHETNSWIFELKPKWLKQNEKGCRNCTMHVRKYKHVPSFCSLDLLRTDSVLKCCQSLFNDPTFYLPLAYYLKTEKSILKTIESLQTDVDFDYDPVDAICLQMMLRDLTIFINIRNSRVQNVTITDMDPKWEGKLQEWRMKEKKLNSSMYTH